MNQWEITYVNLIDRGTLWETESDWKNISESLAPPAIVRNQQLENAALQWRIVLNEHLGRLHIAARNVRVGDKEGPDSIRLELTARGPIGTDSHRDYRDALRFGHDHMLLAFTEMTTSQAHKVWKRTR